MPSIHKAGATFGLTCSGSPRLARQSSYQRTTWTRPNAVTASPFSIAARKVADGTPSELQASTGMRVIEVSAASPYKVQGVLNSIPDVASVTQLGVRLRVLIPESTSDPAALVGAALTSHGVDASATVVEPSLEDVFVARYAQTAQAGGMRSLSRVLAILRKEMRQLRRDRLTFGMVVGIPVIQFLLFGYAINTDVRNLRTAVADQADSHLSRQFVAELGQTQVVDIIATESTPQQLEDLLRKGPYRSAYISRRTSTVELSTRPVRPFICWSTASDPTILGVANQLSSNADRIRFPADSVIRTCAH